MHADPQSSEFIDLLKRASAGDAAARTQLGEHLHRRLSRLCQLKLARDFPLVAAHHELDSVVHNAWISLMEMFDRAEVREPEFVLKWLGTKIRFMLLNMATELRRQHAHVQTGFGGDSSSTAGYDPGQSTVDPVKLTAWTEFHNAVSALPDDERLVVELHYYCDLPQADIAEQLNLPAKQVSRTWLRARDKLRKYL
ncbi:MAG: sigma-70 family RNA polymerase sigma factor [Gemmataceae bacterium]|nr:sigma-70 family RNA polymerase sigma factor [Gemmataceae bacterium]